MRSLYANVGALMTFGCVALLFGSNVVYAGGPPGVTPEPSMLSLMAISAVALVASYKLRKRK